MDPHHIQPHNISPHTITPTLTHVPHTATTDDPNNISSYVSMDVTSTTAATLVEMLTRIDALDPLPKLQVEPERVPTDGGMPAVEPVQNIEVATTPNSQAHSSIASIGTPLTTVTISETSTPITSETIGTLISQLPGIVSNEVDVQTSSSALEGSIGDQSKKPRVGRPRTKPVKEKKEWHYHLGGVRHSRVPLTPEIKEVLEVAYVSRIMSKNFRKEGQPEKERIARITGMEFDKIQEWFKNRRKKDKHKGEHSVPKKRGRPSKASIKDKVTPTLPTSSQSVAIALGTTPTPQIYCDSLHPAGSDIQVTTNLDLNL